MQAVYSVLMQGGRYFPVSNSVWQQERGGWCFPICTVVAVGGQQRETPHGSPQTSRPWRPYHRGLDEREASGHEEVGRTMLSPLLGVQKPWWLVQGKWFQEGLLL